MARPRHLSPYPRAWLAGCLLSGAACDDPAQAVPFPSMADVGTITHLDVVSEDGEPLAEYHTGHPVTVTLHVKLNQGVTPDILLKTHVGLVKKLEAGDASATGWSCYLGSLHYPDKPVVFEKSGSVVLTGVLPLPQNCLPPEADSAVFNVWVALNPATEIDHPRGTPVAQEDLNTQFFVHDPERTHNAEQNAACLDRAGSPGCVLDLRVSKSPGYNLDFRRLEVASNVFVLDLDACEAMAPQAANATIEANVGLTLYGADADDGATPATTYKNSLDALVEAGKGVSLRAALCPRAPDGNCVSGTDYLPLAVAGAWTSGGQAPGDAFAEAIAVTNLVSQRDHSYALDLHISPQSALCQGLVGSGGQPGPWSRYTTFNLRMCADVPFVQAGNGADVTDDDCRVVVLRYVLATDQGSSLADSLSFDYTWDRSTGNDIVGLSAAAGTVNHLNLDGASSDTYANAKLTGWLDVNLLDIDFRGLAYVSILGSGVSAHVDILGLREWGYEKWVADGADTVTVSGDYNFAKDYCLMYNYGIAGVGLDASLCATGSAGVAPNAVIKAVQAAGAPPFDASTRIGDIQANAKPKVDFDLTASAYLDVAVAQGGVSGTLVLLHVDVPTSASLQWGLIDNKGKPALTIVSEVNSTLNCNVLAGDISVWVKLYEPAWCYCDHWYCPDWIPCFNWVDVVNKPLVSFAGYGLQTTLLNTGVKQNTLGL